MKNKYLLLSIIFCLAITGCAKSFMPLKRTQLAMGTTVEICIADADLNADAKLDAMAKAFERIHQIERIMSSYDQASEVSAINKFADIRPVGVSADTIKVIKRAEDLNKLTSGAFDVTVAPLVELWGFGPQTRPSKAPGEDDIKKTLNMVGMDKLKIDYAAKTVRFMRRGMKIDLGGIASGYAADCAIDILKENGIKNAMVNIGGEVCCIGRSGFGRPWKIGIQHPRAKAGLLATVYIEDKAMSTSGDYEKFFFRDGKRMSHIINPLNGMPVADMPASVSITASDCMTADGLATAIFVLGPDAGIEVLKKIKSVEGMIAVDKGKNIEVYATDGFKR